MAFAAADLQEQAALSALMALATSGFPVTVNASFTNPPTEKLSAFFPFVYGQVLSGESKRMDDIIDICTFQIQIHTGAFPNLQADVLAAVPYGLAYERRVWADPTVGATVDTVQSISKRMGAIQFPNRATTFGWAFDIVAKLKVALPS